MVIGILRKLCNFCFTYVQMSKNFLQNFPKALLEGTYHALLQYDHL